LGYETTEYNDAISIVNLIANSSNFSDLSGWIGADQDLSFRISPPMNDEVEISNYKPQSFLKLNKTNAVAGTYVYNSGIQSNSQYLKNGFTVGEKYIFRVKIRTGYEPARGYHQVNNAYVEPIIRRYGSNYIPYEGTNVDFFTINQIESGPGHDNWYEFKLTCCQSCSYDEIIKFPYKIGIFLKVKQSCWLEDI